MIFAPTRLWISRRVVLNALVKSGKFNVTVVKRPSSASFPDSVTVRTADLSSVDSVNAAFEGQDAVVSTARTASLPDDMANPKAGVVPVYKFKTVTHKSFRKATAAKPDFTYILVCNNGFVDWGLKKKFMLNWKESKPKLFDGSRNVFSATRLDSVEQAVFGVMSHPEETRDRFVYVKDIHISQNRFLGMAKKVEAGEKWEAYICRRSVI